MTDEEKKAIEWLKKADWFSARLYAPKILNFIEKQTKEIEELNKSDESKEQSSMKYYNLYRELVDKIKAKIEEFKTVRDTILKDEKELNSPMITYDLKRNDYCEKMLQSLLEKE